MGVDRTIYLIIGYKLPKKLTHKVTNEKLDIYCDEFLPYTEGHQGIKYSIINDDMAGNYTYFGEVIAKISDEWEDYDKIITLNDVQDTQSLEATYRSLFDNYIDEDSVGKPEVILFTHFT